MLESQDGRHSIFSTDLLHFWLVCPFLEQLKQMCNMCLRGHKQVTLVSAESESEVAQSCPTLCDPMDCSAPGSIHGIFQARILEWVAISFSRGSSLPRDRTQVSRIAGRRFTV